jgi:hypothetical protein
MLPLSLRAYKFGRPWQRRAADGPFAGEEKENEFRARRKFRKSNFVPIRKFEVIDLQGFRSRSNFHVYRLAFSSPPGERVGSTGCGAWLFRAYIAQRDYHRINRKQGEKSHSRFYVAAGRRSQPSRQPFRRAFRRGKGTAVPCPYGFGSRDASWLRGDMQARILNAWSRTHPQRWRGK